MQPTLLIYLVIRAFFVTFSYAIYWWAIVWIVISYFTMIAPRFMAIGVFPSTLCDLLVQMLFRITTMIWKMVVKKLRSNIPLFDRHLILFKLSHINLGWSGQIIQTHVISRALIFGDTKRSRPPMVSLLLKLRAGLHLEMFWECHLYSLTMLGECKH